jgi:hypothetical protein
MAEVIVVVTASHARHLEPPFTDRESDEGEKCEVEIEWLRTNVWKWLQPLCHQN